MSKFFTVKEVAEALHLSPKTIYDLAGRGRLRTVRPGCARVLIPEDAVTELLQQRPTPKGLAHVPEVIA